MPSIKESLKFGWEKFKMNVEVSVLATLFLLVLGSFGWKDDEFNLIIFLLGIALAVITIIVRIGYTKIFLRVYDDEKAKFLEIFKEYRLFWKYLGISILMPLIIIVGLLVIILPGIFLAVRLSFAPVIVVDTKMGPIKAIKESFAITKDNFWQLLGFWIVVIFLNILGLMIAGVGLLMSVPLTTFACIHVYRELSKLKAGLITTSPQPTN